MSIFLGIGKYVTRTSSEEVGLFVCTAPPNFYWIYEAITAYVSFWDAIDHSAAAVGFGGMDPIEEWSWLRVKSAKQLHAEYLADRLLRHAKRKLK